VIRRLVAGLIVVGLAVGIWVLWPREDSETTPTTLPVADESTTSRGSTTSTTALASTSTSDDGSHVVTTVEEAERILRDLWFGWFEGIYNQDEERIKEVVGTQAMLDSAREAFGSLDFADAPSGGGIEFLSSEVLSSSEECLVVWSQSDVTFLGPGAPREGVDVLRRLDDEWRLASTWAFRDDLWEADCEAELGSFS